MGPHRTRLIPARPEREPPGERRISGQTDRCAAGDEQVATAETKPVRSGRWSEQLLSCLGKPDPNGTPRMLRIGPRGSRKAMSKLAGAATSFRLAP